MKKIFSIIVENGLIISVSLGLSYLLSYYYQKGKLDYYGVPLTYMDLSLQNIVAIFAIVITIIYTAVLSVRPVLILATGTRDYRMIKIWTMLIGTAIVFGMEIVLMRTLPIISFVFLALILVYSVVQIIITLVKVKEKCSFVQKWKTYSAISLNGDIQENERLSVGIFSGTNKKAQYIHVIVAVVFILGAMFNLSGSHDAESRTEYYIAHDYKNKIVVHNTQDYYILMEREDCFLKREYQIVPAEEIGNIYYEYTGQLKVVDKEK